VCNQIPTSVTVPKLKINEVFAIWSVYETRPLATSGHQYWGGDGGDFILMGLNAATVFGAPG